MEKKTKENTTMTMTPVRANLDPKIDAHALSLCQLTFSKTRGMLKLHAEKQNIPKHKASSSFPIFVHRDEHSMR